MKINTISGYVLAALLGGAIGFYAHIRLIQPIQITLAAGDYSTRLMENSANLAVIDRNDIACLNNILVSRLKGDLESATFYRTLAANSERNLKAVNDAISFAENLSLIHI